MKKNKIAILLLIILIPFFCNAEVCKKEDIKIEKIELNEVKGNAEETSSASNENNQINLNTKMNVIGDSISYKVVIKNTSNSDYVFDENQITKDYINYDVSYEDDSNMIKAGKEKKIYLKLNYENKPQVENLTNGVLKENSQVSFQLSKSNDNIINPETRNRIITTLMIIIISFGITIIIGKKIHKALSIIFLISFLLIPYMVNAVCTSSLDIHLNLEIDAKEATFLPGTDVNIKMKHLAGDDTSTVTNAYTFKNQLITSIKHSEAEPESINKEEKNIVSTPESEYPIYMWYEDGTIYWWSEDQTPSINPDASHMFQNMTQLNNMIGLKNYDTSKMQKLTSTFTNTSLENLENLANWNTKNLENMEQSFGDNTHLLNISGLENWDTSNVTSMYMLLSRNYNLNNVNALKNWNVSKVKNMQFLFMCCFELEEIDLRNWKTSSLEKMDYMFASLYYSGDYSLHSKLKRIQLSEKFDTKNVIGMQALLYNDQYIEDYSFLKYIDTSSLKDISGFFQMNVLFNDLNLIKDWDVSKVSDFSLIFADCESITSLVGLENWDVSNMTSAYRMFMDLLSLEDASAINNWDISNVTNYENMFNHTPTHPEFTKVEGVWNNQGTFIPNEEG